MRRLTWLVPSLIAGLLSSGCREPSEPATTLAPAALDRACVVLASCDPPGADSPSACAAGVLSRPGAGLRLTEAWIACIEAAHGDCEAVAACAPAVSGNPCDGVDEGTLCLGERLVSCWSGAVEYVSDCAAWDLACGEVDGRSTCRGDGPSCLEGRDRCERSFAVMCIGSREAAVDCAELVDGRTCTLLAGRATCMPPSPTTCTPATTPGSCEGDELSYCSADGTTATASCVELGFPGCVTEEGRAVCGTPTE